jgi:hypothetical protein
MFCANRNVWAAGLGMLLGIAFCLSSGCGGPEYEGEQRAAVSGSVTLDAKPVVYGNVRFVPADGGSRPASGLIRDGKYSIPEEQGPNLGKYKVSIVGYEKAPAAPTGEEEESDDEDAMDLGAPVVRTEMDVDITAEGKPYDFALKSE